MSYAHTEFMACQHGVDVSPNIFIVRAIDRVVQEYEVLHASIGVSRNTRAI